MSESTDTPKPSDSANKPAPTTRKPRSWKRRIVVTLILFIAFTLILRASLGLLLPMVLRKIASGYDLDCTYERSELMLLSGDAGLWHLAFAPKGGGEPVLKLDYVRGNISVLSLLTGHLDVWRMEADGVKVLVERTADGKIPMLDKVLAVRADLLPAAAPGATTTPASNKPINLSPPLKLDAFRLSQVQVAFIDRTLSPPLETTLSMNMRVSDVQSTVRPISFSVDLWADPLLDQMRIDGTGQATAEAVEASMRVQMYGLHPMPVAPYLRMLGIEPVAKSIALESTGKLTIKPAPNGAQALQGSLALGKIAVRADGQDAAVVDNVQFDVESVSTTAARIGQILVEGAKLATYRSANGNLRYSGFELTAATNSSKSEFVLPDYDLHIAKVALKKVAASFDDLGINPPAALAWQIDDLTASNISTNLNHPQNAVDVTGRMSAPGISESIQLTGKFNPASATKSLSLALSADAIKPDALKPYLEALGLQSELKSANFTLEVNAEFRPQQDGKLVADAQVAKLRLTDGKDLMVMDNVKVGGLRIDLREAMLNIDSIDVSGPTIQARRDASGMISALGMHGKAVTIASATPTTVAAAPTTAPTTSPAAVAAITLPRIYLGKLNWKDIKVQFDDQMSNPPSLVAISDAGLEVANLTVDVRSPATQPGTLRAWMNAPGLVEKFEATGTLSPGSNGLATSIKVDASGITANAAKPYLMAIGIEPSLTDGKLHLAMDLGVLQVKDGLDASLEVREMSYSDGTTEIAGVDRLAVQGVTLRPDQLGIGTITMAAPRAVVSRDARGVLGAAGIRLVGHASTTPPPMVAPSTQPSRPLRLDLPIPIVLNSLDVSGARLTWKDSATTQPVETTATISAQLGELVLGKTGAAPAKFKVNVKTDGSLDDATVTGELLAAPDSQKLTAEISADGVRAAQFAAYLPPGIQVSLKEGRFRGNVAASLDPADGGGQRVEVSAKSIGLSDGANTSPLLKVDSFELKVPRFDLSSGVIAIDRIVSEGIETDVRLSPNGELQLPGLKLVSAGPTSKPVEKAEAAPLPTTAPAGAPTDVSILVANARKPLPLISIETLDLKVARASLHDDSRPDAAPLTIADLQLRNSARILMGGKEADSQPPIQLELSTRVDPLVNSIQVNTKATPLANEPAASAEIRLSGIKGEGITKLVPALSSLIDGSQLTDGQFKSNIDVQGKFARRGPAEIDLTRPFDLQLQVKETEFRAQPDGPVLAGVEGVSAEGIHVDPATGVVIRSLEITKPIGKIWRDDAGIHAGGILVKLSTASTTAPSTAPSTSPPVVAQAVAKPTTRPAMELRIDRFLVSGVDFTAEDRSFDPPVLLPVSGLDVEVRSLSNLLLYEERTVRFNAVVTSGEAPLPSIREGQGGQIEPRELFSQVTASGVMGFYPAPSGWAKASVNGFELVSLRGVAKKFGMTLGKGVFDTRVDLRLTDEGDTVIAKTRTLITDLQISEPAGGPIQKAMALPGTLDLAFSVVGDPDGSITLPVEVPIRKGQLSMSDIGGAAVGAAGAVVTTAITSAPAKVVGGVANILGGGGPQVSEPIPPVELTYAPGSTSLESSQIEELAGLIQRMGKDENLQLTIRHEFGGGDLIRANLRANPTSSDAEYLAYQLHQRKLDLLQERASLAGQARAEVASLPAASAKPTLDRLADLDTRIALTEDALDSAGALLRPGADRQSARRTRGAALRLADDRVKFVNDYLNENAAQFRIAAERISKINPTLNPAEGNEGGKIVITLVSKKRQG